ncbi:hypothetical protein ACH79_08080 [Bradyrhizobium sp. CCBAU 051011]|jgi:hypothetical protein|uniref:hypothetical protein n=1 Tax=Bradyrhizobium sp. CCBAU 051011 TaxID=858422 RepID=UPI0013746C16|nr:hypothetical protein [Bradyrhizobium sp. CCBAU 051011]QHO72583.1 hypothetical protein ACH79_08080 [Bradyrhizobium sp. CCBAU 051011]
MLPSLHDDFLVSYEVNCETRQIKIRAKRDPRIPAVNKEQLTRIIVFNGVEGYQFENDAFGNIISSLETISVEKLLAEYGSRIAESYHWAGAPGPWAADLSSAPQVLAAKGVQGFVLSSSYGLSGWVLAKEALVEPA